jgi:antitoxin MazE
MEADIVSIGNSRGIRIPAHILKLCGIEKKVRMEVRDGQITLTPVKEVRQGWEDAFRQAASRMAEDDMAIYDDSLDLDRLEGHLNGSV